MLNMSYVFTSSPDFQRTLDSIVAALNKQGFSKYNSRDTTVVTVEYEEGKLILEDDGGQLDIFSSSADTEKPLDELISDNYIPASNAGESFTQALQQKANDAYNNLEKLVYELDDTELGTTPLTREMMQPIKIRDKYIKVVKEISIPQFMRLNMQKSLLQSDEYILVEKEWLLNNFKLSQEATKINFDSISVNIREVDLIAENSKEYLPQAVKINIKTREAIMKHINSLSNELQLQSLANITIDAMGKMPPISQPELKKYTQRVIEDLDPEKLAELKQSPELYAEKLKIKIQGFMLAHAEEEFKKRLGTEIVLKESFVFPDKITLTRSMLSGKLGLYSKEEAVNSLENKLKGVLEEMDNIIFWHRNISRRGFEINGNINHYPDFIIYTESKKIILLETKGEHLNADKKIKLGDFYTKYSNQQIHYLMVFENNAPKDAYNFDGAVDRIRRM